MSTEQPVRYAMTGDVLGIVPSAPLEVVLRMMARTPALAVAASDDARTAARWMTAAATDVALVLGDGVVVGIVTATDLLRLLAEEPAPPVSRLHSG
jgi:CBS domain-containing protein